MLHTVAVISRTLLGLDVLLNNIDKPNAKPTLTPTVVFHFIL